MFGSTPTNILEWYTPRVIDSTEAKKINQYTSKYSYFEVEPGDILYEFRIEIYTPLFGWSQDEAMAIVRDGELVFIDGADLF